LWVFFCSAILKVVTDDFLVCSELGVALIEAKSLELGSEVGLLQGPQGKHGQAGSEGKEAL